MTFHNVGAYVNGERPKSKKAVREAIANGDYVTFDGTATMFESITGTVADGVLIVNGDVAGPSTKLALCGPDPYTKRSFYGTVENVNGKVKVS